MNQPWCALNTPTTMIVCFFHFFVYLFLFYLDLLWISLEGVYPNDLLEPEQQQQYSNFVKSDSFPILKKIYVIFLSKILDLTVIIIMITIIIMIITVLMVIVIYWEHFDDQSKRLIIIVMIITILMLIVIIYWDHFDYHRSSSLW